MISKFVHLFSIDCLIKMFSFRGVIHWNKCHLNLSFIVVLKNLIYNKSLFTSIILAVS